MGCVLSGGRSGARRAYKVYHYIRPKVCKLKVLETPTLRSADTTVGIPLGVYPYLAV